jgi:hypothetical protein
VLFVGHETKEVLYRARVPENMRCEKWLGIEWLAVGWTHDIKSQAQM